MFSECQKESAIVHKRKTSLRFWHIQLNKIYIFLERTELFDGYGLWRVVAQLVIGCEGCD